MAYMPRSTSIQNKLYDSFKFFAFFSYVYYSQEITVIFTQVKLFFNTFCQSLISKLDFRSSNLFKYISYLNQFKNFNATYIVFNQFWHSDKSKQSQILLSDPFFIPVFFLTACLCNYVMKKCLQLHILS
jgi:hypothetical protein